MIFCRALIFFCLFVLIELNSTCQETVTYARFVPERSDDFAFENDKVAFRIYGPALKNSGVNNGIDCILAFLCFARGSSS